MQVAFFDLEEWQADYLQAGLQQLGLAEQVQAHYSTEHLTLEDCARYAACKAIAVFVWTKITRPDFRTPFRNPLTKGGANML